MAKHVLHLAKNSSFRQEVILPILSKLGVFNDNQHLRRIVGQPITTAPIHDDASDPGGRAAGIAHAAGDSPAGMASGFVGR